MLQSSTIIEFNPLSEENNAGQLTVSKHACAAEAFVDLILRLLGLCLVYLIFKKIGEYLIGDSFSGDILLSLVVLPSILVLKDIDTIIEPYFVSVFLKDEKILVKQGIFTTSEDSLSLKTVENIEVVTTILGKWMNYSTLRVYAYGSWIEIPNVKDAQVLKKKIEEEIKKSNSKKKKR
jgi:hypothetical protein